MLLGGAGSSRGARALLSGSAAPEGMIDGAAFHRHWRGRLHFHRRQRRAGIVPGGVFELPAGAAADRAVPARSADTADGSPDE